MDLSTEDKRYEQKESPVRDIQKIYLPGAKGEEYDFGKKTHFFEEIKSMGRDNYAQTSVTMFCPKNHILI